MPQSHDGDAWQFSRRVEKGPGPCPVRRDVVVNETAAAPTTDTNGLIAALLRDLASVQKSTASKWGYKRAAAAILALDEPIES